MEEHLNFRATAKRSHYRESCRATKSIYKNFVLHPELGAPAETHYSFDFAQQVHIPSDPLQPGPVYFLTPRKCALFGVCCEAVPLQV